MSHKTIGPYKLLQKLGEGGMGVVWMANQTHPVERRVALKIIKPGMDSEQVIARFEAERQALALMDHPNVARVLDAGRTDAECPYFVMELVKGVPITQHCDEERLTTRQRLELFVTVCHAVQHAHQKGIIHRDLKPSNVLVAMYDGRPVPKIIDFGVAKALTRSLTERTMFTEFGQVVGTFEYMSPEQAELNQLDVDTRTDVYSLGVLLYQLLTGATPFSREQLSSVAFDELLRIIREVEPPRPSARLGSSQELSAIAARRRAEPSGLSALVRGDLDWIVMKALEKDRERRYETANALAADVQRHLDGEPVLAAPPSARYRLQKFAARHRVGVLIGVAVAVSLLLGALGTTFGLVWALDEKARADHKATQARLAATDASKAREEAILSASEARDERDRAEESLYVASLQAADLYADDLSTVLAQDALRRAPAKYRNWEWAYLANHAWQSFQPMRVEVDDDDVRASAEFWSRGRIQLLRLIIPLQSAGTRLDGDFMPDGNSVLLTHDSIGRYSLVGKDEPHLLGVENNVLANVEVSPDGRRVISAASSGIAQIWDLDRGELLVSQPEQEMYTPRVYRWSPDQRSMASLHFDQTLRLWDTRTLEAAGTIKNPSGTQFVDVQFAHDGGFVLAASLEGAVRLWSLPLSTTEPRSTHIAPIADDVNGHYLAPGGRIALITRRDGSSYLWSLDSDELVHELTVAGAATVGYMMSPAARFSPDGSCVALESAGNQLALYDTGTGELLASIRGHAAMLREIVFSRDGRRLLTVSDDGTAKVWTAVKSPSDDAPELEHAHSDIVFQIDVDEGGRRLLTGSYDLTARIWDLRDGSLVTTYRGHQAEIVAVDLDRTGGRAATLDARGHLHVWDATTGESHFAIDSRSERFAEHISEAGAGIRDEVLSFPGTMSTGIFSPDGAWVVLFHEDSMKVFDAGDGSLAVNLEDSAVCGWPVFNHDSSRVAVLGMNVTSASVWDLLSGEKQVQLRHRGLLGMLHFSPVNDDLVTSDMGGRAYVWDTRTGQRRFDLGDHPSFIVTSRYTADGRFILTGSARLCRVFDAATGELVTTLAGHMSMIRDIRMSPDGTRLVSWSHANRAIVWDFSRPESHPLVTLGGSSFLLQAHWTPDGRDIVSAWSDGGIRIWSGATQADLGNLSIELAPPEEFEDVLDAWRRTHMKLRTD